MKYLLVLIPTLIFSLDLTHINDYFFLHEGRNVELEGYFAAIDKSHFKNQGFQDTTIKYQEAAGCAYFGGRLNQNNSICGEVGYNYFDLDWPENPKFTKKHFQDLVISMAYVTTSIDRWRWVVELGAHIDTEFFNLSKHTFATGVLWGRLMYTRSMGIHFGLLGQTGVKSTYILPIIGMDFYLSRKIKVNAVFPLDISMAYIFNRDWRAAVRYRSFGGWYKANHRLPVTQMAPEGALVAQSADGIDLGLYYKRYGFSFSVFGGGSFGGWLLIQNPNHSDLRYYHFKPAPYVGAKAELAF
ncbi:MAG: hypothetical protein MRY21_08385 [Simkaniaceae bacterium]|nr:hypothetical protein [Simkaniaceae bacterium]